MFGSPAFERLLTDAAQVLHASNPDVMESGRLLPTPNEVDTGDVELFFRGVGAVLVELRPDGRFNTADRPTAQGH